jgi:hypothetical protein
MEGVNSLPSTPQQLRKQHILPVLILTPEDQGKQKRLDRRQRQDEAQAKEAQAKEARAKEEEKKHQEEAEKREQERLKKEREEKQEQERLELERKRQEEEERERELERQKLLPRQIPSPRTTNEDLDFSECNIINNPGESLEYFNLRVCKWSG